MRAGPALAATLAAALLAAAGHSGAQAAAEPSPEPHPGQAPAEPVAEPPSPVPSPEADRPLAAGSEVPAPRRKKLVLPEYPEEAKSRGVRGIVLVELEIERDGSVGQARVLRSIPLLDEAALEAVRQWQYEPTRVDGQPVRVLLSVPITFSLKLPDVTRQEGVPELRSGVAPVFPETGEGRATVEAEVTLDQEGKVSELLITRGDSPWSDAVIKALRTWMFQVESVRGIVSFKLRADFRRGSGPADSRVDLALTSPRVSETVEPPRVAAAAVPAPSAPAPGEAAPPPPDRSQPPVEVLRVPPKPAEAQTAVARAAGPEASGDAPTAPAPTPSPRSNEPGISAVRDVLLGPGVPDLTGGRRPVVPPLLRIARQTGTVLVEFSVGTSGACLVGKVEGPDLLHEAARQMVSSWVFRRTSTERLFLTARVEYGESDARASVTLAQ